MKICNFNKIKIEVDFKQKCVKIFPSENGFKRITTSLKELATCFKDEVFEKKIVKCTQQHRDSFRMNWIKEKEAYSKQKE